MKQKKELLGITVDRKLFFEPHLLPVYNKVNQEITCLRLNFIICNSMEAQAHNQSIYQFVV